MGFFSRFFNINKFDTLTSQQPDFTEPMTEIGINAQTAAAILAEIDVDSAIASHENWKQRLQKVLEGTSDESFEPAVVCLDNRCDLGQWLHGPGEQRLGRYPAFQVLIARHQYFHTQASAVVAQAQSGDMEKARKIINSSYRQASSQVILLLKELKRGLGR